MKKIKIFISSALKELMNERLAVKEAITDNEFLNRYFDVEMWEGFPPMAVPSRKAYLEKLKECDIYIGFFGNEYGTPEEDGLSPTEREYRQAKADDKYILHSRISSEECTREFGITRDTANRDFKKLMDLELIEQRGSGRATHYILKE